MNMISSRRIRVNEMFDSLTLMKKATGETFSAREGKPVTGDAAIRHGEKLLEENVIPDNSEIWATGMENSGRKMQLLKLPRAYRLFQRTDHVLWYIAVGSIHSAK